MEFFFTIARLSYIFLEDIIHPPPKKYSMQTVGRHFINTQMHITISVFIFCAHQPMQSHLLRMGVKNVRAPATVSTPNTHRILPIFYFNSVWSLYFTATAAITYS